MSKSQRSRQVPVPVREKIEYREIPEHLTQSELSKVYKIDPKTIRLLEEKGYFKRYQYPEGIQKFYYLKSEVDQTFKNIAADQELVITFEDATGEEVEMTISEYNEFMNPNSDYNHRGR